MSNVVIFRTLVSLEGIRLLVDGVVGQVHIEVVKVALLRALILLSSEPSKSFSEDKNSQRIDSVDQDVDPHIEFKTVNKVRLMHVPLANVLLASFHVDVVEVSRQIDAPALARSHWFDDESLSLLFGELRFEVTCVGRQDPSFGKEVILVEEHFLHPLQVPAEKMLVNERMLL